ncbi:hypothetical protein VT06_13590 [Arsukibacterium sp. MJ3]|jgi:hypothetical protein|uniref:hypothetical protein n=1 Tax=Arsukibacterium sp. MJ3 TaxID=1632859 RepID=UPI0006270333|nr:hypothetical protein [Arsukibacterium sp. MJ3]KKO48028.1 hypothetical protein VT06_13590 [Arsukibacterium sp. MJ3]
MVSDKILSRFKDSPPEGWADAKDRTISCGPLYEAQEVALLITESNTIRPSTQKCSRDIQELALENDDLAQLLTRALKAGRYVNSVWCRLSSKAIAACDAYVVSDKAWVEAAGKELECQYYLKFAIGSSGKLLLMVSCHLSQ